MTDYSAKCPICGETFTSLSAAEEHGYLIDCEPNKPDLLGMVGQAVDTERNRRRTERISYD